MTNYTFIAPQMSPIHFRLLEQVFRDAGLDFHVVEHVGQAAVNCGLRCVNNDFCCPAILTAGSVIDEALRRSAAQPHQKVAIIMTQTGGGCRASNYVAAMRLALKKLGRTDIPVIPLSFVPGGDEKWNQLGFKVRDLKRAMYAVLLGDVIMSLLYQTRPYELHKGDTDALAEEIIEEICHTSFKSINLKRFKARTADIHGRFRKIATTGEKKPKIGVVGEILLKYHPDANNHLVDIIEQEGCEAVVTPLIDFFLYCLSGPVFQHKLLSRPLPQAILGRFLISIVEKRKRIINQICGFHWPSIYQLSKKVAATSSHDAIISLANSMGEGWLLPAEMVELIEDGCPHIIIAQPFACLPNHAIGEGTKTPIAERLPEASIVSINYDPSITETNQRNRIKLFTEDARDRHKKYQQSL